MIEEAPITLVRTSGGGRASAGRRDPSLPKTWVVRALHYQRDGFRQQRLITSVVDPDRYPADQIVALYHERWEIELFILPPRAPTAAIGGSSKSR